ncbi:MAG: ABC transporter ATP-binding protein [Euryarchaeota archaeon]|nr:ABC transporter ATP-binding protein [Euryarchaeota archaeon]
MDVIKTENLVKCYSKNVRVLDGISLSIKKGEIVGYLGPNGSGKTTTIKILTNLLYPTSGHAFINGLDVNENPKESLKAVGALVEIPGIYDYLTPREMLTYFGRIYGMERGKIDERIRETLKSVRLADKERTKIGAFSTGMQRRLAIAKAILHEPEILILDEPVIGLDPKGIKEVRELLREFQKGGMTIFLSSHLLQEVGDTCDSVIFLDKARVVAHDTVHNIRSKAGGKSIIVRFTNPLSETEAKKIETVAGVKGVSVKNGSVQIGYDGSPDTSYQILSDLMKAGHHIVSYTPEVVSLEDFYISVMSDERGVS